MRLFLGHLKRGPGRPDGVNFVAALPIARRSILAVRDFSPKETERGRHRAVSLLCRRLNRDRRYRSDPRLINRKYVKWQVKRAHHRDWPQRNGPPVSVILAL